MPDYASEAIALSNSVDDWLENQIERAGGETLLRAYCRMILACYEFESALARVLGRDDAWIERNLPKPKMTTKRD